MLHWLKEKIRSPRSSKNDLSLVENGVIPEHVAIIMDGNGRWAKKHGLPRSAGHRSGMKNVKKIVMAANRLNIKVLTLYAFSTENWKRPKEEINFLMSLPQEFFPVEIQELMDNNIQVRMIGYKEDLPDYALDPIEKAIELTRGNDGMILNFAINYGSRKEIITGIQQLVKDVEAGKVQADEITEELYASYLQTQALPEPDLLIRTSGEMRISNFMLWQLAYTELWFTDVYWPDFKEEDFYEAVKQYQCRHRRYGAL